MNDSWMIVWICDVKIWQTGLRLRLREACWMIEWGIKHIIYLRKSRWINYSRYRVPVPGTCRTRLSQSLDLPDATGVAASAWLLQIAYTSTSSCAKLYAAQPSDMGGTIVPSTALTSDDLDTQMAPVQIMLFVAALFIYVRTFYTCTWSCTSFHYNISAHLFTFLYWKLSEVARVYS